MEIDENVMNRLLFVKIIFDNAIDQSKKHEPFNLTSILSLHDSIEFLLKIYADIRGIDLNNISFLSHWKKFEENGFNIPEYSTMVRLNEARKSIKHYANLPSSTDINDFIKKTKNILIFIFESMDLDFDNLSLHSLIHNSDFIEKITSIKHSIDECYYKKAIESIAEYMYFLFSTYKHIYPDYDYKDYDWLDSTSMDKSDTYKFKKMIPTVTMFGCASIIHFDHHWPDDIGVPIGRCPPRESIETLDRAEFGIRYITKITILLEKDYGV